MTKPLLARAHHIRPCARANKGFVIQLAVRRRCRMDDEAARVADIGEVREQLHRADQLDPGVTSAFQAEGEDRAAALRHVTLLERVIAVVFQTRSEEQTSELQSLMRISYAVFGLK